MGMSTHVAGFKPPDDPNKCFRVDKGSRYEEQCFVEKCECGTPANIVSGNGDYDNGAWGGKDGGAL